MAGFAPVCSHAFLPRESTAAYNPSLTGSCSGQLIGSRKVPDHAGVDDGDGAGGAAVVEEAELQVAEARARPLLASSRPSCASRSREHSKKVRLCHKVSHCEHEEDHGPEKNNDQQKGGASSTLVVGPTLQPKGVYWTFVVRCKSMHYPAMITQSVQCLLDQRIPEWSLAPMTQLSSSGTCGKTMTTLTHHKKPVRALAKHPKENCLASASADNIKKFDLPQGEFMHNMLSQQKTIINAIAVNEQGVMAAGGDNGSLWFWGWKSGHDFQQSQTIVQPGSLDSEAGIYAISYDITGSQLVTCEADKTIKLWKEDEHATPETHPVNFKPPKDIRRF